MDSRRLYLVAYDIREPQRLRRVLHVVKAYATGGQKSVYECFLTPAERAELTADLGAVMDRSVDSIVLLRLDPRMRSTCLGVAVPAVDPPFFYQG